MISIQALNHAAGSTQILHDITLTIPRGGLTALIGPNGAGKSTLLNLIAAQADVQSGAISVDDLDVATTPRTQLAQRMAVVAQRSDIASRLTVGDLVEFGRWPHSKGRLTPYDRAIASHALQVFDLTNLSHRFLDEISGGQRQRAFVAMAYTQQTDWLMLDEPLNNLDIRHARGLMGELSRLVRQEGRSIVIVLHDLNHAAAWADHVVALEAGRVAFSGAPDQVLTAEALSALYKAPIQTHMIDGRKVILHHR